MAVKGMLPLSVVTVLDVTNAAGWTRGRPISQNKGIITVITDAGPTNAASASGRTEKCLSLVAAERVGRGTAAADAAAADGKG